ncbi:MULTISPECIES: hypothetical protein [unclassified Streptomyces]|uniref:hypothetical protein n=1 Tax=unclassified Streptomyces TaxID=2593676 RepID=UPI0022B65DFE|nr:MULTISPECIES: hypothetical protein [unclassified Streptomyces]MCZ7416796.1 hypothetical protein [Streptomyces sp. WMMC897]MCZ7433394.1 hypothetical protein [Streptomyces sp. WMMC1477]
MPSAPPAVPPSRQPGRPAEPAAPEQRSEAPTARDERSVQPPDGPPVGLGEAEAVGSRPARGRRAPVVAGVVVLAVLLAVGAAVWLALATGGEENERDDARPPRPSTNSPSPSDSFDPDPPTTPPASSPPPSEASAPLPEGWEWFRDVRFDVAAPEAWRLRRNGVSTFIGTPGERRRIQVFTLGRDAPQDSMDQARAIAERFEGYERDESGLVTPSRADSVLHAYRYEHEEFGPRISFDERFTADNGVPYSLVTSGPVGDRIEVAWVHRFAMETFRVHPPSFG